MSSHSLAKNTTFFAAAMAIQKVLSFLYFALVARGIGVENTGKYTFALSFTTIFAIVLDLGLTQILIRESARDKEKSQKYLAGVLGFKLLASFIIYGAVILIINLMGYPQITKELVYVSGFVMLLDSFSLTFYGMIRGKQNLSFESMGIVINQFIVLVIGFIVLKLNLGLVPLMAVYLIGSIFNFAYSILLLRFKFGYKPALSFKLDIFKTILKIAMPFAIAGIFVRIYSSIDVVMLSKMADDRAVGIYSVAMKIVFALQFVATAFSASLYPAFSKYFVESKELLAKNFVKSIYYLMILSLPLVTGVIMIADKVITPIFGQEYSSSIEPLKILIFSLIFVFLCFPLGAMLNACDKQSRNTVNLGITALFNIVLNIFLIPQFSYMGAAASSLASYGLLFILDIWGIEKIIKYDKKFLIISFLKNLVACVVMAVIIFLLRDWLNFIIVILIAIVVYFVFLYLIRGFNKEDINEIKLKLFRKKIV
ncbi:MAG: flippase [Candidatus Buchananbacteria bacterium]